MNYAIVGFGTAGYYAARTIREYDPTGRIEVYANTSLPPYNPMLTTYYVSGKLGYDGLFPYGGLNQICRELQLHFRQEAVKKVHANRCVETESKKEVYDRVLIATGAHAAVPPVPGLKREDTFLMRTVEDALALKSRLEQKNVKKAVVIGASMVGIKVAEVLHHHGAETVLLDLAPHIFPLAAYPDVARAIEQHVQAQGISLKFSTSIHHMEEDDGIKYAVLTDGTRLETDIVALCVGTRAAVETVQDVVEINRGILVNTRMETSVSGIYAAGDCCEGRNLQSGVSQIIGLWANANRQGQTAGASMAGHPLTFDGSIPHNNTHFLNMDFLGFGDNRLCGEMLEWGSLESGSFIRLVIGENRILGANILGAYAISGILKNHMLRLFAGEKGILPDYQRARLVQAGIPESFLDTVEERINGQ